MSSASISKISASEVKNRRFTRRYTPRLLRESLYGWAFALPFTIIFVLSFIIPIISALYSSFFKPQLSMGGLGPMEEVFAGFSNYQTVLTSNTFWNGMLNVAGYGIIKIPLVQGLALILALLIDSLAARGIKFFRLAYFLPYAIPGIIAAILWAYIYSPNLSPFVAIIDAIGLPKNFFLRDWVLNFSMANMTAWSFVGYNMIIFLATLKSVPTELYEAARIDGASELTIVRRVKLPMLKGALLMTILMSIIGTVQWFNEPTVMRTMVPSVDSNYTPMMMAYSQAFSANNYGAGAAISVVMAVIAAILAGIYAFAQTRIGKGLQ